MKRTLTTIALLLAGALVAAGCGDGGDAEPKAADEPEVLTEHADDDGPDPFTPSVASAGGPALAESVDASASALNPGVVQRGTNPGLYGGSGDQQVCDAAKLVAYLEENADKGRAWAGVIGIDADEIGAYVETLTPVVLLHDARVTNHGFSGGRATPRQSVLEAGTAVLVDQFGTPRARCACGNPLREPEPTSADGDAIAIVPGAPFTPVPVVVPHGETPIEPVTDDFCEVWAEVAPTVVGGPTGPSDVEAYLDRLAAGLGSLVSAAEATEGFPADALADLTAYRDAIAVATPESPGDSALRDRVEDFLTSYCDGGASEPVDPGSEVPEMPGGPIPDGNCGSMQFFLLIAAADGIGLDWEPVAQPYLDQLESLDTDELSVILEFEEIGCAGAQAMQQLFEDTGNGDLLEGTLLD